MNQLNEILKLTMEQLEKDPEALMRSLPHLVEDEDGNVTIPRPAFKDGVYGTEPVTFNRKDAQEVKPGDPGYEDENWSIENQLPEGWTIADQGDGTPSMEGYMCEVMGLPKRPQPKRPPKGFG